MDCMVALVAKVEDSDLVVGLDPCPSIKAYAFTEVKSDTIQICNRTQKKRCEHGLTLRML